MGRVSFCYSVDKITALETAKADFDSWSADMRTQLQARNVQCVALETSNAELQTHLQQAATIQNLQVTVERLEKKISLLITGGHKSSVISPEEEAEQDNMDDADHARPAAAAPVSSARPRLGAARGPPSAPLSHRLALARAGATGG